MHTHKGSGAVRKSSIFGVWAAPHSENIRFPVGPKTMYENHTFQPFPGKIEPAKGPGIDLASERHRNATKGRPPDLPDCGGEVMR